MKRGKLLVISGPSGCGKSTVIGKMMAERENVEFSVSATTRPPRPGEREGVDYFFVSRERFEEMIRNNELLEHAEFVGNCYGTPKSQVCARLERGVLQSLPPILYINHRNPISDYSKALRGLSVQSRVIRIFTYTTISPGPMLRQRPNRYAIRAGQNLPDKEFRYLRTVIVTAAVHWGLSSVLRLR